MIDNLVFPGTFNKTTVLEGGLRIDAPEKSLGLTKRELFAAMAMQGVMSSPKRILNAKNISQYSVCLADALIAELQKVEK